MKLVCPNSFLIAYPKSLKSLMFFDFFRLIKFFLIDFFKKRKIPRTPQELWSDFKVKKKIIKITEKCYEIRQLQIACMLDSLII